MNNFEDILENTETNSKGNSKIFNKEEWKLEKQKERTDTYNLIDDTALKIVEDVYDFKKYLDVQSRFDKYSVGNALLVTAQMPDATQLKEYQKWKSVGATINKNAKAISILEPSEYTNSEGTISTAYNVKKVFDISQTNLKTTEKNVREDDKTILKALTYISPVKVQVVDEIASGKGAELDKDNNVLYVVRGLDSPNVFHEITREYARLSFSDMPKSGTEDFKSQYASYMICSKLGIDVSNYKFSLPKEFANADAQYIRNEITTVHSAMEDVNNRANQYFEDLSKSAKNKEQER